MDTGKPLRVGVLGLTHDHVWGVLDEARASGDVELVAAAEPYHALQEKVHDQYGLSAYGEVEELLDRESLDAVYVFADNATGAELTELAADRGLHVLVEKPMAADLEGADRMLAACRRANVRLMINWPFAWWPPLAAALRLAREGRIGQLWQLKYRAAHAGPREIGCSEHFCDWLYDADRNGAGAMMDYCCYGAVLARTLLGVPSRVTGVANRCRKEDITVEDNGVIVMTYPGALAVAEGSWTQAGELTSYVTSIHGTTGTLVVEPHNDGRVLLATEHEPHGTPVEVEPLPPHLASATAHFVHAIRTGEALTSLCDPRMGRDAQEILEAGIISSAQGREISLPLRAW